MSAISLDEPTVKLILGKALLEAIPQDKRDFLLSQAIASLLEEKDEGYGRRKESVLMRLFQEGIRDLAQREIRNMLDNSEGFKVEIRTLIQEAWEKLVMDPAGREALTHKVAIALERGLTGER